MSLYQEIILDHYHNPRNFGVLNHAHKTVDVTNPLCGDKITMQITGDTTIQEIAFSGEGCAISLASASLLTEFSKGKSVQELKILTPDSIINMLGIEISPNRLKCALLSLEALKKLII